MTDEWNRVDTIARALEQSLGPAPQVALVLGSGLGGVVDSLTDRQTVEASALPGYPASTVAGHAGRLHTGRLGGTPALVIQGRVHLYEGHEPAVVVRPVRAAVAWGVTSVILTNAAGGIGEEMLPGRLMLIADHLNLTGRSPLVGPNDDTRGPRFPNISELYTPELQALARRCAGDLGVELSVGTYAGLLGPTYETPAEVRMLRSLGADAVGMSTVHEAIAAGHMGAQVLAISCITNRAAGLPGSLLDHEDVQRAGAAATRNLSRLLETVVAEIGGASS